MNFFQYQPQVAYAFRDDAGTPTQFVLTDITARSRIAQRIQEVTDTYYDYVVADFERPDTVAVKVYGQARYTWLVLLLNNLFGVLDWPMNYDEFQRYIIAKYGSLDRAQAVTTDTEYYFDASHTHVTATAYAALSRPNRGVTLPARYCFTAAGVPIDAATYDTLSAAEQGSVQTPYEYELDRNEEKRRIKVVNSQFLSAIDREYRTLFQE